MIRAQALWYERAARAEIMEALAVRDAARWRWKGLSSKSTLRLTGAQQIVTLWKANDCGRSEVGSILHDINNMSGCLASFTLSFVGRDANVAAHLCAKRANESRR